MPSARLRFQPGVGLLLMNRLVGQVRTISCFYLVLCFAGATKTSAQEFRGALRGVVQDSNGGRVPAAKIFVHATESSFQREIASDSRGEFRVGDLLPGTYRVKVQASGFANIAYLAPGTEPLEPSDPTKARITAVSTGGSSGLNNDLTVDGADNTDDWIGGFLQNFSPEAIEEFAIRTAQEDADTGRTTAASVVITTKAGTNVWHGSSAFYGRAAGLNARFPIDNPAPDPKQPFSRQNYVGTVGGPVMKDKLWFFSSLEYVHENASIAYSPASQTEFNALAQLASQGLISTPAGAVT